MTAEQSAAYDSIDRFLRNNLDDSDYAEYSADLDRLIATPSALPALPVGDSQDKLIEALESISYAADHHYSGCEPGPMRRMPPDLRDAILQARVTLARAKATP